MSKNILHLLNYAQKRFIASSVSFAVVVCFSCTCRFSIEVVFVKDGVLNDISFKNCFWYRILKKGYGSMC